jgi:hypothetical protein
VSKHWIAGAGYGRLQVRDLQTECEELAAMVRRSSPHTAVAAKSRFAPHRSGVAEQAGY